MGISLNTKEIISATEWASTKDSTVPAEMLKEADFYKLQSSWMPYWEE